MADYIKRGVNDDRCECEHCGKTNLKRVVWLEVADADGNGTGEMLAVGTNCAVRLLRGSDGPVKAAERKLVESHMDIQARAVRLRDLGYDLPTVLRGVQNRYNNALAPQLVADALRVSVADLYVS